MLHELKNMEQKENILVHIHGLYNYHTYSILATVGNKVPVVGQSHSGLPSTLITLIERPFHVVSFRNVDQFFALSSEEKRYLSKFGQAKVQPMGIDFDVFKPIKRNIALEYANLEDRRYITFVGRLTKDKGLDYLFEAFKYVLNDLDVTLLIVGEGPYKNELKSLAKMLKIENNVVFVGHVPNNRLVYYYNIAEITVFPSLKEGYGLVPVESLACKTPVISTDVGAIREIADHFNGGVRIIPKGNSSAIAQAIREVLDNIDYYISQINRKKGEKYHSWDYIIKSTLKTYDTLYSKYY